MLKITISCDDVNPSKGHKILGERPEKWMRSLNEEFGAKFTLFIPAAYHRKNHISKNKQWVNDLKSVPYFELCGHGMYHDTTNPQRFGEMEFAELQHPDDVTNRLELLCAEWNECGFDTADMGWRNPGWICSEVSKNHIQVCFKYAAIHTEHNHGLQWKIPIFVGHDNINAENVSIHNEDMIMFQSHIAGKHNLNVWSQESFEQLWISLRHLTETYNDHDFKTLKECL